MTLRLILGLCLLAATACGSSSAPAGGGPVDVTVAHLPNLTHAAALVAVGDGSLTKALAPHTLDVKAFSAGPALIEALLAGDVDIAYVGTEPGAQRLREEPRRGTCA